MARSLLLVIGVLIGLGFGSGPLRAEGTVTNLTHVALEAALADGGFVSFEEEGTIVLTNAIRITSDTELDALGMEVILSGNNTNRIFEVESDVLFTINGIQFSAGSATNGAALYIHPNAIVELTDCVFAVNNADGEHGTHGRDGNDDPGSGEDGTSGTPGRPGLGGAIYNAGDLTMVTCLFQTNGAFGGNGGNGGNGGDGGFQGGDGGNGGAGAIGRGGAIYHIGTALSITDCTFEGNSSFAGLGGFGGTNGSGPFFGRPGNGGAGAIAAGGAIFSLHDASITGCTFVDNGAVGGDSARAGVNSNDNGNNGARGGDGTGGAVYCAGESEFVNCTFFANEVFGGNGGDGGPSTFVGGDGGNGGNGFGGSLYSTGIVMVVNCTFSSGRAFGGTNGLGGSAPFEGSSGNPGRGRGVNVANAVGELTLINTLIATNTGGGNITNVSGTIVDGGHNISSDASFNFTGTSLKNTNPRLNPLGDNGGPTLTMSLQISSPAIDAADDLFAPDTDQRGVDRPDGPHSDIGAFEAASPAPVIQTQPQSQNQTNGGSVTFSVLAAGAAPLRYFWTFNGANISSATTSSYTIGSVAPSNAGIYSVLVSNQFGSVRSSNTTLSIFGAGDLTISGRVMDGQNPLAGVTINADTNTTTSGADGTYLLQASGPATFFVFASLPGYKFSPAQEVNVPPAATNINFFVSNRVFTVSGRVMEGSNGLAGVTFAEFASLTTDDQGFFSISELIPDTYTFTPRRIGSTYAFSPTTRTVVLTTQDVANVDFVAGSLISAIARLTNGSIQLTVIGPLGSNRIEASTNLQDWEAIFSNRSGPFFFLDSQASNYPTRYYRAYQVR